jgi:hypothetical protein
MSLLGKVATFPWRFAIIASGWLMLDGRLDASSFVRAYTTARVKGSSGGECVLLWITLISNTFVSSFDIVELTSTC